MTILFFSALMIHYSWIHYHVSLADTLYPRKRWSRRELPNEPKGKIEICSYSYKCGVNMANMYTCGAICYSNWGCLQVLTSLKCLWDIIMIQIVGSKHVSSFLFCRNCFSVPSVNDLHCFLVVISWKLDWCLITPKFGVLLIFLIPNHRWK